MLPNQIPYALPYLKTSPTIQNVIIDTGIPITADLNSSIVQSTLNTSINPFNIDS